ncbi:hypothetical protein [Brevibacterium pityocampae]|uniref:Uncharacterized protein n=1 Tax=Brevibacterium pityocampae TaxID=506594 RepID=A0ABP8JF15_9MICO
MAPNPKREMDIVDAANSLKTLFLAQNLTMTAMLLPGSPVLQAYHEMLGSPPDSDLPIDLMKRDTDEGLRFSAKQAFDYVQKLPSLKVQKNILAGPMLSGALTIGNLLIDGSLIDPTDPLTQFAKHFRNAAAHGDKWHFDAKEPRYPAHTANVKLDRSFQNRRATFETVGPYEYFTYLDEIVVFAGRMAVEKAVTIAYRNRANKNPAELHASLEREFEARGIKYSDPSIQTNIAFYSSQIFNGINPKVRVTPKEYPLLDSEH